MYFIHRGTVEVVSEHDEPIIFDTMGEGRFFGEISVVFSCPRTASIRLAVVAIKLGVALLNRRLSSRSGSWRFLSLVGRCSVLNFRAQVTFHPRDYMDLRRAYVIIVEFLG